MRYIALAVVLAGTFASQPALAAEPMQAGIAVVDITPPVPFRMSGYFYERPSTGVKDPLHAKAIVFQQGDESAAIVFCDLVGISHEVSSQGRAKASEATGIPVENIAVSGTHTHTGPLYFGALHDEFHRRALEKDGQDPLDSAPYRAELIEKIAAAIVEANNSLQPVQVRSGFAHEDRFCFNRRFHMKNGLVQFNPGNLNPNIVRPAGPVDPQVGIITLSPAGGDQPAAAIVSYASHLDTMGGTEYSADYPRFLEDHLRSVFGPEFTLLFGIGTCGDVNHIDVTKEGRPDSKTIGTTLGEAVATAIRQSDLLEQHEPALAVRRTFVNAPLQKYSEGEIEQARAKLKRVGSRELTFLEAVEAVKIIDLGRWPEGSVNLEVQAFRLDRETAIVTLPAEIFVELGLAIKAASPFKTTLVVELTNEGLSYIPTRRAFVEGSYEVVNSRIEPGTGERLVEAAVGLLKELE